MPIYEYICKQCEANFEELVFSTREKVSCPKCGADQVERTLSVFSYSSGGSFSSSQGASCGGCTSGSCSGCHGH